MTEKEQRKLVILKVIVFYMAVPLATLHLILALNVNLD